MKLLAGLRAFAEHFRVGGILLFATFPLLGNAIAYRQLHDRRITQASVLVVSLLLLSLGLAKEAREGARRLLKIVRHPAIRLAAGMLIALAIRVCVGLVQGPAPGPSLWIEALVLGMWISLLGVFVVLGGANERPSVERRGSERWVIPLFATITLYLVYKCWTVGPDPGEVFMSFGGSTTVMGVCASIIAYAVVTFRPNWLTLLVSTGATYIMILSTSRSVFVVNLVFLALLNLRLIFVSKFRPSRSWLIGLGAIVIALGLFILPARTESRYFPFFIPKDAPASVTGRFYREEYIRRWSRLLRAFPFCKANDENLELECLGLRVSLGQKSDIDLDEGGNAPARVILQQAVQPDTRFALYRKTWNLIAEKPWGYWPARFSEHVGITCGGSSGCEYPHNFPLEAGFYFGWWSVALIMGICGLLAFAFIRDILRSASPPVIVSAVSGLGLLLQTQISGNFLDTLSLVLLTVLWLLSRMNLGAEGSTT